MTAAYPPGDPATRVLFTSMASEQTTSPNDPAAHAGGHPGPRPPCRDSFDRLQPPALVDRYRAGIGRIDMRVAECSDADLDRVFAPPFGSWSCRALLTHLMDTEMLYAMRLRRIFAEDNPVFEPWDGRAFLDSRFCRPGPDALMMPAGALLASIYTTRQTTATWLVQCSPEDWNRRALCPVAGETTAREILARAAWHLEHHAAFLNAKIELLIGPATEPPVGSCGEGCCCARENN